MSVMVLFAVAADKFKVVKPAAAETLAFKPAPVVVIDVSALELAFAVVSVSTPVPDSASVRRDVSVMEASVVLAVTAVFRVVKLVLSVRAPSEPPPRFRAKAVGAPDARLLVTVSVLEAVPVD